MLNYDYEAILKEASAMEPLDRKLLIQQLFKGLPEFQQAKIRKVITPPPPRKQWAGKKQAKLKAKAERIERDKQNPRKTGEVYI